MYLQSPEQLYDYAQSRIRGFRKESEIERLLRAGSVLGGSTNLQAWLMGARQMPILRDLFTGAYNRIGISFTPEESPMDSNQMCCAEG